VDAASDGTSVRIIRQLLDVVEHMERTGDVRHGDIVR
jgi:hypothetical protein